MRSHTELKVYQLAFDSAMMLFEITKVYPVEEKYALTSQIRSSSRSVAANISEAFRKRRYPGAFIAKLSDAETEAAETLTWLDFSYACNYLDRTALLDLKDRYDKIIGMLVKMIRQADAWKVGG